MTTFNPEFRRNHDLPFVEDGDPKAAEKLAGLLGAVIDFKLPGVGIAHMGAEQPSREDIHNRHAQLALAAFELADPAIQTSQMFKPFDKGNYGTKSTAAHVDGMHHYSPDSVDGLLHMMIRLHTTGSNGAFVRLANARAGSFAKIGDSDLFSFKNGYRIMPEGIARGYDIDKQTNREEVMALIDKDSYDPVVAEPDVYHFKEDEFSSVLFRSSGSFGPTSIHSFKPINPYQQREVSISRIAIYSQTL